MAIQNLSKVSTLSTSDLVAIYSGSLGQDAAATLASLVTFLQAQLTANSGMITQYFAPGATGFSTTVLPVANGGSVYLLMTPLAGYAAGTIVLPAQSTAQDGQEVLISTTQAVTTLTVSGNGATAVLGAPTTLAANAFFRLRYDGVNKTWYRVG